MKKEKNNQLIFFIYPYWLFAIIIVTFLGSCIFNAYETLSKILHGISVIGVLIFVLGEYLEARKIVQEYTLHPKPSNKELLDTIDNLMTIIVILSIFIFFYEFGF